MTDRKVKVLAIEDDPDNLDVLRLMLERSGYDVHSAGTAPEALAIAHREHPDLILLDLKIPGPYSGAEVLEQLRSDPSTRAIKVIVQTASGSAELDQACPSARADGFLRKPFSMRELLAAIERHL